jgi:hypothetical protein
MSKCKTENCKKYASFGKEDEGKIACKEHSTKEMVFKNNKCKCKLAKPTFGFEFDKTPTCCSKCKSLEMINMYDKLCKCGKSASFGLEKDKKPTCCKECKSNDMINIRSTRCFCGKFQPSFGLETDETPTCCSKCKTEEMIDIRSTRCLCGKKGPSFGLASDIIPTHCLECKTDEMINIKSKKCECGLAQPSFGLKDDIIPTYCAKCKTNEMISIKDKNRLCNCGKKRAIYGLKNDKKPSGCIECKTLEMTNIVSKKCLIESCNTRANPQYKGYCAYCYSNLFPDDYIVKNLKTKERQVVDFIREQYPDYSWKFDKIIDGGSSRRRPDIFLDLGFQIIIIEVDENQHNSYENICENKRLMEISRDVDHRSIIFIRFNPDRYTDKNNNNVPSCFSINKDTGLIKINNTKKWNERLLLLLENVDYWIKNKTEKTIELILLFYNEN